MNAIWRNRTVLACNRRRQREAQSDRGQGGFRRERLYSQLWCSLLTNYCLNWHIINMYLGFSIPILPAWQYLTKQAISTRTFCQKCKWKVFFCPSFQWRHQGLVNEATFSFKSRQSHIQMCKFNDKITTVLWSAMVSVWLYLGTKMAWLGLREKKNHDLG